MPNSSLKWHGDDFLDDLAEANEAGLDGAASRLTSAVKRMLSRFGPKDPVQPAGGQLRLVTGTLRRAVDFARPRDGERHVGVVKQGGATDYARVHEFGNKNTPARPFMRPALAASQDDMARDYLKAFEARLATGGTDAVG